MDAARELAELADGELQLADRVGQHVVQLGAELAAEPLLRSPQLEGERDEPLLGAVVEVALDPPPLVVAGGDDSGPRLLHLRRAGRGARPGAVRSRARAARRHRPSRGAAVLAQARVVDERRERLPVALEHRHRPTDPGAGSVDWPSLRIGVRIPLGQPERELEARIVQGAGERVAELLGRHAIEVAHEIRDVGARRGGRRAAPRRLRTTARSGRRPATSRRSPRSQARRSRRSRGTRRTREARRRRRRQERHEDPPGTRRGPYELPDEQCDEAGGEEAEEHDHEGALERPRELRVAADDDRALGRERRVLEPRPLGRRAGSRAGTRAPSRIRRGRASAPSGRRPAQSGRRARHGRTARS